VNFKPRSEFGAGIGLDGGRQHPGFLHFIMAEVMVGNKAQSKIAWYLHEYQRN